MATLADRVFDSGLTVLDTEVDVLHICSQQPTTYAQASSTYTLGNKATPTIGAPADRTGGGREVTVSAITDGTVTGSNTATHYALVDSGNSRLLATGALAAPQGVVSGNTFTLASFKIGIPDPA
jgi:hypothetical protein